MASDNLIWNVILVGESGVGKTTLTLRFTRNKFVKVNATVAVDNFSKDIQVNGRNIKLIIWDSGGQENYKSIVPQYFRVAEGCVLVYDVTRITTFHKLSNWLSEFRTYNETAPVIIVGNKSEDPNCKAVNRSVIKSFAEQEDVDFMECSAKTGENVEQVFDALFQKMWKKTFPCSEQLESSSDDKDVIILEKPAAHEMEEVKNKKKKCCRIL